jgi:hypothetical protein
MAAPQPVVVQPGPARGGEGNGHGKGHGKDH